MRSASERRRELISAWCFKGSRSDLRRCPRHRCALATPVPPARVSTVLRPSVASRRRSAGGLAGRHRRRRPPEADETTNQRRLLPTCRSSLVAAQQQRVVRRGEQRRQGAREGCRDDSVGDSARRGSPRASRRRSRKARRAETNRLPPLDRPLADRHYLWAQDLNNFRDYLLCAIWQ